MNEEDIKILEDLLNRLKYNISLGVVNEWKPNEIFANALENLINRNKELEEENKELLEIRISASAHNQIEELRKENNNLKTHIFNPKVVELNYIPKSKIKEKIEKLQREFDFYAGREHSEWQDGEFDGEQCDDISLQIRTLKELLEKE